MIKVICVGKIKEDFYRKALDEYLKRLTKYTKMQVIELTDFKDNSKVKEAELIEKHLMKDDYIITLEIEGRQMTSEDLSVLIENQMIHRKTVTFIIGGSYGLDDRIKNRADYHMSFSKLTFPHQLFRVVLFEQIYRAFKIMNNETYHK